MTSNPPKRLSPHLSPPGAWAFAIGTSIGWGSMFITGNTYLPTAGPIGTVLGLVVGALIMLVVARNYHYMIECYPGAGGAYTYSKEVFGNDRGFLTAWFLALTYFAMLWANATALPLFARYFFGDVLAFGKMYTLFDYDVYFGEALVSIAAVFVIAALCMTAKRAANAVMIALAALFCVGIVTVFVAGTAGGGMHFSSGFADTDASKISQIATIAAISPWAFIGFESISHSAEEFTFRRSRIFRVFAVVIASTTLLYAFVTLLSASAYPERFGSWTEYIKEHDKLTGLEGLPVFYAAHHYLGDAGVYILMAALLSLIVTSLIGNIRALSRLLYATAKDRILPEKLSELNSRGVPANAIALVAAISLVPPFIGRVAIGWIVDVTTLGATIIYGFVSAATLKTAVFRRDRTEKATGAVGLAMMILLAGYMLIPNLYSTGMIEKETFLLFVIWSIIGIVYFSLLLRKDRGKNFGKAIFVWLGFFSLILFIAIIWMSRSNMNAMQTGFQNIQSVYASSGPGAAGEAAIEDQLSAIRTTNGITVTIVIAVFVTALGVLIGNYQTLNRRMEKSEAALVSAKDAANTDPLTGVKSKHAFAEAEAEINVEIAEGRADPFAVAVCDVNGLKIINDTQGHKAGDRYIQDACKVICGVFKHSPVYRIGGDEFVVLLRGEDYDDRAGLYATMVERNRGVEIGEGVIIACGISDFRSGDDVAFSGPFERADAQMYENKKTLKGARL